MSIAQILEDLEQNLFLPSETIKTGTKISIKYRLVSDACIQSCGCIMSQRLSKEISDHLGSECPVCHGLNSRLIGPVAPLRHLYDQIQFYRNNKNPTRKNSYASELQYENLERRRRSSDKTHSLLSLFHQVALKTASHPEAEEEREHDPYTVSIRGEDLPLDSVSLDNISNAKTIPIQDNNSTIEPPIIAAPTSKTDPHFNEEKEYYFAKCFPMYRKRSQFNTHSKFLRAKSKLFINNSISPDGSKFALLTQNKWEVFSIPSIGADSTSKEPELLFCGKINGEYGTTFETLTLPKNPAVLQPIYNESWEAPGIKTTKKKNKDNDFNSKVLQWEHIYCKLNDNILVISGTLGIFRVFDLAKGGEPIYTYCSSFPIRCIDINPINSTISCGITGKDRTTGGEQALLLFHTLNFEKHTNSWSFPQPITITLPYRDPIHTLQFSSDGRYLSCSTALESRFLVISVKKINEPRLVMKSLRSLDTSLESEGITDTKMFPGNPNLMCVTSVAFNASPIVINTKIETINGVQTVAQPTMLLRLDEIGSKIHKCEISPRNDSIAFLDRNGTVYIMFAPTMIESEKRRIVTVEMVANAYRMREAASMRFSKDGHVLYILDRKGTLYIEDFAYGLPQNHEVTKCKQIN